MPGTNRWLMALAGVCLQMALGAAYAWSVFRIPLAKQFGWTISQITSTFLISWFFLGCAAVVGGLWMKRSQPRIVAMTAGLLWGGGVFLASFSANRLWWLYLTYGVIGGIGLGGLFGGVIAGMLPPANMGEWGSWCPPGESCATEVTLFIRVVNSVVLAKVSCEVCNPWIISTPF